MGDFNLDLLHHEQHPLTGEFVDLMFSHLLYPLITKPTCLTSNTASLIDNIFTNNLTCLTNNGLIVNDLSDHLPIFSLGFSNVSKTPKKRECIVIRDFKSEHVENFCSMLDHVDWGNLDRSSVNSAYDSFLNTFSELYNSSFPVKVIQRKRLKTFRNPWLTKGIMKSINTKSKLYKKFLKNPTTENERAYKDFKNNLSNLIRTAKRNYYDLKLANSKTDLKATWNILNMVIN